VKAEQTNATKDRDRREPCQEVENGLLTLIRDEER
jgi:hypothetical protein